MLEYIEWDKEIQRRAERDFPGGLVQWLRLRAPNAGDLGLIPGLGTRSHMLQLRVCMLQLKILHAATKLTCCKWVHMQQLKILHAATKTQYNQINL